MTAHAIIRRCITRCAAGYRDGRGPAQAERACAQALGGSSIDRNTAAAASLQAAHDEAAVLGLIAADHAYSVERVRALKAAMRRRGRRRVEAIRALLRDWQVEI